MASPRRWVTGKTLNENVSSPLAVAVPIREALFAITESEPET